MMFKDLAAGKISATVYDAPAAYSYDDVDPETRGKI